MSHSQDFDLLKNICCLGLLSPKEFSPGRHIEKKITHFDPCSGSLTALLNVMDLSSSDADKGSSLIFPATRGEFKPRHTGNARKSLPAKSHRSDRCKISTLPDLAGGMSLKAKKGIGAVHTRTIVSNAHHASSPPLKLDDDPPGPGINGVLYQFLDDGGRSLHHLTGRHLAG